MFDMFINEALCTLPPIASWHIFSDNILNGLITLAAAFFGAWFAFLLQKRRDDEEKREKNVSSGNRALIVLLEQANSLRLIQTDLIDPFRESQIRHIQIKPTLPFSDKILRFNVKELEFLITSGDQQLLLDLIMEENRYRETTVAVDLRSKFLIDVVEPTFKRAGIQDGVHYEANKLPEILGHNDNAQLRRLTDSIINQVEKTLGTLVSTKDRLLTALKKRYPKNHFIDFEHRPSK